MIETELVVLLDEAGREIGTAPKSSVHGTDTALHLAFSCHIVDEAGRVLVTRRALGKQTWPGVWTNSVCGHPVPGEEMADAVARRAAYELGLELHDIQLALPDFRYRATDASGIVEYEVCPVYLARTHRDLVLNPDEVMDARWTAPSDTARALSSTPWAFSPWFVLQAQRLDLFSPALTTRVAP